MAWTYSGDPTDSPRDELRFLLGDTDSVSPIFSDEELDYFLGKVSNDVDAAYILALRSVVTKYARLKDETVNEVTAKYSQIYAHFRALLQAKEDEVALENLGAGGFYAGGISVSDKQNRESDTDRVRPKFTKDFGESLPSIEILP